MRIKPLRTVDELYEAMQVNNFAWKEAYQGLLPDEVIESIPTEPPEEDVKERFEMLDDDESVYLVAVGDDGSIRGYIYVRWGDETKKFVNDNEADLKEIYVHPDWWGQGIGTTLLNEAVDALPSAIEAVRLEMLSGNENAHEFYLAHDFERDGESEFKIGEESYPTDIYVRSL